LCKLNNERQQEGQAEHDPELVQAALQVHVERVGQHAGEWVSRQSQEHLDQVGGKGGDIGVA
jgi:hypothetical protein